MSSYPSGMATRATPRGMSLLECIVALGILAMAATMFSSSTLAGIAAQEDSMALTMAVAAGEGKMSEFLACDWDDLAAGNISEEAGGLVNPDGSLLPTMLQRFNRDTVIWPGTLAVPDYDGLAVEGMYCTVTISDTFNGLPRTLCVLERFRPQTVAEGAEVGDGDDNDDDDDSDCDDDGDEDCDDDDGDCDDDGDVDNNDCHDNGNNNNGGGNGGNGGGCGNG